MVELMLALGLMGLVMSVVLGVFLRSGRETDLELRRSGQLGQSIALISQLEASLAASTAAALGWRDGSDGHPALLAAQTLISTPYGSTGPSWQPYWDAYRWDAQTQSVQFLQMGGANSAKPQLPAPGLMLQAATNPGRSRLLASSVSNFRFRLEGTVAHLWLEFSLTPVGRGQPEKSLLERRVWLRNRN
ncbi:MAG: hypothetical protein U0931_14135 [Vulcanimicrobiota bacterium]